MGRRRVRGRGENQRWRGGERKRETLENREMEGERERD